MNKELAAAIKLIANQDKMIKELKEIINRPTKEVEIWLALSTMDSHEGFRGIEGCYFLRYEEGKFEVVDGEGVKIPHQTGIEIEQDLDQWMAGSTRCKVEMYLNAYIPKDKEENQL